MTDELHIGLRRRDLLSMIGTVAGSGAMYQAMTALGHAAPSPYRGPIRLDGDPKGASVLILGAGLAGMVAALELRQAGYKVRILEYNGRAGGRNWSLRGGDSFTELGGATQHCEFDKGLYINPGPWRIPYHHHAVIDYCRRLGVALEPFIQLNHNALLHTEAGFGGKPQRVREVMIDFKGHIAELLAKSARKGQLDEAVSKEDQEILLEALQSYGALDKDYAYGSNLISADFRGFSKGPGGGLSGWPKPGEPLALSDLLRSRTWAMLANFSLYYWQSSIFQPVGGMGRIGEAFGRKVGDLIRYNTKVTRIQQSERQVTITWEDAKAPGKPQQASADWCVCTIPLPVLSQIPIDAGAPLKAAIQAIPYAASVKIGLQFKRRFWEEDEAIFGGISYTDLPIEQISYPSTGFNGGGKGVLLGAYIWDTPNAYEFTALSPEDRVRRAVEFGAKLHPQYPAEFENGVAVAWHRMPFILGCAADWNDAARDTHYNNLCGLDGRLVLAGEHASFLPGWQEGAILSSLDAISRLHQRVIQG